MKHVCDDCPNGLDDCYPVNSSYCDIRSSYVPLGVMRVGGECICEHCGKQYYDHPKFPGATWATVLCSGEVVKL